jgi:hypothetical protein
MTTEAYRKETSRSLREAYGKNLCLGHTQRTYSNSYTRITINSRQPLRQLHHDPSTRERSGLRI